MEEDVLDLEVGVRGPQTLEEDVLDLEVGVRGF